MGFINIYIISFLCGLSLLSTGRLFNKLIFKTNSINYFESFIFGFIFFSFLALGLNFFISLNQSLNLFIFLCSLVVYFLFYRKYYKKDLVILIIASLFSVMLMAFENVNRPDAGLYHLPFINIVNDSQLIVGLSNIHFRYGHISVLQYISSLFNNSLFKDNGILVPTTVIFLSLLGYFIYEIFNKNSDKFVKILSLFFSVYILLNMNRYSSWGNDDFASILFFIIIIESYKFNLKSDFLSFSKIILYCSICFLIKTFYLIVFLIPGLLFLINFKTLGLQTVTSRSSIFCLFLILLWILRTYLTTSCLIFPINLTCFGSFDWSLKYDAIKKISLISEAWSKDWPNFNNKEKLNYENYISNFNWLSTWVENHFLIILKNIFSFLPILVISKFFIKFEISNNQKEFLNFITPILIFLTFFWFLKFPILRYGEGIIVSFFIIVSFYFTSFAKKEYLKNFSIVVLVLFSSGVILKNSAKFYKKYNNYYLEYPWPKKNTFSENNEKNEYIEYFDKDKLVYVKPKIESNLCMYGKSPCAAIDVNKYYFNIKENISIKKGEFLIFDSFVIKKD